MMMINLNLSLVTQAEREEWRGKSFLLQFAGAVIQYKNSRHIQNGLMNQSFIFSFNFTTKCLFLPKYQRPNISYKGWNRTNASFLHTTATAKSLLFPYYFSFQWKANSMRNSSFLNHKFKCHYISINKANFVGLVQFRGKEGSPVCAKRGTQLEKKIHNSWKWVTGRLHGSFLDFGSHMPQRKWEYNAAEYHNSLLSLFQRHQFTLDYTLLWPPVTLLESKDYIKSWYRKAQR